MIGLVRLALRRPYTMAIAGMLILLMGFLSAQRMVVDIFPTIDIPVVYVAWNYPRPHRRGHGAARRAGQRARLFDHGQRHRAHRIAVDPRASASSRSISSRAPTSAAPSRRSPRRTTRSCASRRRACTPPNMIQFNASNVPVVQVTLNSKTLPEQQIFDYGLNFLRMRAVHHPGPVDPGAVRRQAAPDHRRRRSRRGCSAKGLSQMDVVNALQTSNVIVPAGIARIGEREYNVKLNSSPQIGRAVPGAAGRRSRRRAGVARRRRQGQRQLRDPAEHRAHQRPARQLPGDPEALRRLDARRGRRDPRRCCRRSRRRRRTGSS